LLKIKGEKNIEHFKKVHNTRPKQVWIDKRNKGSLKNHAKARNRKVKANRF